MGIPWDETGMNCYGMGMGQINMSYGQHCILQSIIIGLSLFGINACIAWRLLLPSPVVPNLS